jgi:hypothetical protein
MSRDVDRLVAILDAIDNKLPRWDDPANDGDVAVDALSDQALELAPGGLFALGAAITRRRRSLLYRYSVRAASRAVTTIDPHRAKAALAAGLVAEWHEHEPRELMINLAPHHVAATRVNGSATALFGWAAGHAAAESAETIRTFGTRTDVTLEAFGWKEVQHPSGTWFVLNW